MLNFGVSYCILVVFPIVLTVPGPCHPNTQNDTGRRSGPPFFLRTRGVTKVYKGSGSSTNAVSDYLGSKLSVGCRSNYKDGRGKGDPSNIQQ